MHRYCLLKTSLWTYSQKCFAFHTKKHNVITCKGEIYLGQLVTMLSIKGKKGGKPSVCRKLFEASQSFHDAISLWSGQLGARKEMPNIFHFLPDPFVRYGICWSRCADLPMTGNCKIYIFCCLPLFPVCSCYKRSPCSKFSAIKYQTSNTTFDLFSYAYL